jgi:hypothetical protein
MGLSFRGLTQADYGNCLGLDPQACMLGVQRVGVRPPSS